MMEGIKRITGMPMDDEFTVINTFVDVDVSDLQFDLMSIERYQEIYKKRYDMYVVVTLRGVRSISMMSRAQAVMRSRVDVDDIECLSLGAMCCIN